MNKRKIRLFGFAGITLVIILVSCFLLVSITTLRNNVPASNDMALETKAASGTESKTSKARGAGHKPSFSQLWSRSEVFMY